LVLTLFISIVFPPSRFNRVLPSTISRAAYRSSLRPETRGFEPLLGEGEGEGEDGIQDLDLDDLNHTNKYLTFNTPYEAVSQYAWLIDISHVPCTVRFFSTGNCTRGGH
jgi:hypothetical protein